MIGRVTSERKAARIAGFSLLELLFVVAIVGILASIAIPSYLGFVEKARVTKAVAEIRSIASQVDAYRATNEAFPPNLAALGLPAMNDPWGQPYQYLDVTTAPIGDVRKDKFLVPLNSGYDLYSRGKDQLSQPPLTAPQSKDDVIRANDGEFLGLASLY